MTATTNKNVSPRGARKKLLEAALTIVRSNGYSATTVDDLCAEAGVTKGAFFYHFKTKDELAVAAADYWSAVTGELFANADYHQHADPLQRILGYIDLRKDLVAGHTAEFTCLVGTMVQETFATHDDIREACNRSITGHAETLEADIAACMGKYGVDGGWSAKSLALHTQAVLQGAFILAKAKSDPEIATDSVDHLRRYIELLFKQQSQER